MAAGSSVEFRVDASEIRDGLIPVLRDLPALLHDVVLMRTLNRTGDMARTVMVRELARESNVKQREVRSNVIVSRASRANMQYEMRVRGEFLSGLVHIITTGDEKVCPICVSAAARGPYTPDQIKEMRHAYPHRHGLLHPNCRCQLQPVEREVRGKLREGGEISASVQATVRENMPRIFAAEYRYAAEKLRHDHGVRK